MVKRAFFLIAIIAVCFLTNGCIYLLKQGASIAKYETESRPIDKLLKNPALPADIRELCTGIGSIREFAFDTLGLKRNRNFTRFVPISKGYIVSVVVAARPLSFDQYYWWFPVVGRVPYKGFFSDSDAVHEAKRLKKKGFDVSIGRADAFSMLGFASDPVYSYMKNYTPFELASMIFHEQTHATIYLKSRTEFNEAAASFVGTEGGLLFVKERWGGESGYYNDALDRIHDERSFNTLMRELYDSLKVVYASAVSDSAKRIRKQQTILRFQCGVKERYDSLFYSRDYKFLTRRAINNAYIMAHMTYTDRLDTFYKLYRKFNCSLPRTIAVLKSLKGIREDPETYIRRVYLGASS